jgi:hypothetical protein
MPDKQPHKASQPSRIGLGEGLLIAMCFIAVIGLMLLFVSPPIGWTVFGVCAVTVLVGSRFVR